MSKQLPSHFGPYGGRYVPEMLIPALEELEAAYLEAKDDPKFQTDLVDLFKNYAGRPTPLYHAKNLTSHLGGAQIYIKNEGLNHTGAHKMNHALGQALLAQRMGKKRIIAETGAGQHGLASATVAARFGFDCTVYMGAIDVDRQRPNVFWMQQLGATVEPVTHGSQTLKDAVNAALKDWITNVKDTYYLLGSALGPHPYPTIVRDFQSIVGREVQDQLKQYTDQQPDYLIACTGGGSNALGLFHPYLESKFCHPERISQMAEKSKDPSRTTTSSKNQKTIEPLNHSPIMIGVEAGGKGVTKLGEHASRFNGGRVGVVEGYKTYFLQDDQGNIAHTHSISAGLDYAGIGPELAYLRDQGRVQFTHATDDQVLSAFKLLASSEGIIGALESLHAIAETIRLAPTLKSDQIIIVNLSGRGDKDLFILTEALADDTWTDFLKSQLKK